MGTTSVRKRANNTVLIGVNGALWPHVPQKLSGSLFFEYDPYQSEITWSSGNSSEVLGIGENDARIHGTIFLAHIHEGDRYRVERLLQGALRGEHPYVATYRWIRPDNLQTRIIHTRAILDTAPTTTTNDTSNGILRGVILDLTTEVPVLQNECDHLEAIDFSIRQFGGQGATIGLDHRIRTVHGELSLLSLGLLDCDPSLIANGALLKECFRSESSRDEIDSILSRALSGETVLRKWPGFSAAFKPIIVHGMCQGVAFLVEDTSENEQLTGTINTLRTECLAIEAATTTAKNLLDKSHEIVGLSALISRYASGESLVNHASTALLVAARESADMALHMLDHAHISSQTELARSAQLKRRPQRNLIQHQLELGHSDVIIAASDSRSALTFSVLIRDGGITCSASTLEETELHETIRQHASLKIVTLELSSSVRSGTLFIKRLKKLFPALSIVVIVPGSMREYADLHRAGAGVVLTKPVTPDDLLHVLKALLNVAKYQAVGG